MVISDIVVESIPRWLYLLAGSYSDSIKGLFNEKQYLEAVEKTGLVNGKIEARLIYDELLIQGGLRDQLNKQKSLSSALWQGDKSQILANLFDPVINTAAKALDGKVASIRVIAQKPLANN